MKTFDPERLVCRAFLQRVEMLHDTVCAGGPDPGGMNPPARWGERAGEFDVASRGVYPRGVG